MRKGLGKSVSLSALSKARRTVPGPASVKFAGVAWWSRGLRAKVLVDRVGGGALASDEWDGEEAAAKGGAHSKATKPSGSSKGGEGGISVLTKSDPVLDLDPEDEADLDFLHKNAQVLKSAVDVTDPKTLLGIMKGEVARRMEVAKDGGRFDRRRADAGEADAVSSIAVERQLVAALVTARVDDAFGSLEAIEDLAEHLSTLVLHRRHAEVVADHPEQPP